MTEKTVTLRFARAFKLRLDDDTEIEIGEGEQTIPAEVEDHWYVQENLYREPEPVEEPAAPVTDDEALKTALSDKEAAEAAAKIAEEALQAAAEEKAAAIAEAEAAKQKAADAEKIAEEAIAKADADQKTIADLKAQLEAATAKAEAKADTKTKG